MLDKLNKAANLIAEMISSHPDSKKKKPKEGSADEEAQESAASEQAEDSPAARTQKSMRKAMGGMKEPS